MRGPRLYWIDDPFDRRLAVSERPMGHTDLEDEIAAWRESGIDMVVSMLEEDEAEDLGLSHQGALCRAGNITFISCPITDHGIPDDDAAVVGAARAALSELHAGKRVAAHCFAGIGRSPLFVATVLLLSGITPEAAWQKLAAARGRRLPDTQAQKNWLATLARGIDEA